MERIKNILTFFSKLSVFAFLFLMMDCSNDYLGQKKQCYADNGCHDAFASCNLTFNTVIKNKDELSSWCILTTISCREFCDYCARGGKYNYHSCFTNRYKPFFGLADGKEDN
jgi:hypothetical protein